MVHRKRKPPRDSTQSTALGGLNFWDVPQIAAYSEKLFLARRSQMQRLLGVRLNFLSEGVRFVLSQNKKFGDSTRSTALNFLVWDGTKMCPLSQEIQEIPKKYFYE